MDTPPASAALAMSPIMTLPLLKTALMRSVESVAPHRASIVLTAAMATWSGVTTALQNEGQNSHSTMEPSMAKRLEVSSLGTGSSRCFLLVSATARPRPKYAPKAWMMMEPAESLKPAVNPSAPSSTHFSLSIYSGTMMIASRAYWNSFTRPSTAPIAIRADATANSASNRPMMVCG